MSENHYSIYNIITPSSCQFENIGLDIFFSFCLQVCLKAYTQFSNLCRHKRMHADCRQQIKCNDCGQAFSTITSLSKHKRFCEGALRNGMRMGTFGPETKLPPSTGLLGSGQAGPFSPAMMMGLYGTSRPAYPFYPPTLGNLPMFPSGHPFSALTSLSPGSLRSPGVPNLTPEKSDLSPAEKYEKRAPEGSDGGSDIMSGSDLDNIPSDSESEKSASSTTRPQESLSTSTHTVSVTTSKPSAFIPLSKPSNCEDSFVKVPKSPDSNRSSPGFTKAETEALLDLSKASHVDHITPPKTTSVIKDSKKAEGDQPLDLSQTKDLTPPEAPRKTHIFGEAKTPVSSEAPRLHYAYPQFSKQLLMEQAMRMAESKDKAGDSSFLRYPRFPFSSPSQYPLGINPFSFVSRDSPKSGSSVSSVTSLSPQGKGFQEYAGSAPHIPQFTTPNKLKDRYSCKFCGKVFPRSANLTRHLRTHTGEQPYKCKYCERSFSISSNLQRHVRNIHNKEKPFRCPLCDRCFGQQTNLDRHLKKHETEGPNIVDSPEHTEREIELEDKDESYFSEIRNFIGKATTNAIESSDINQNSLPVNANELRQKISQLTQHRAVNMEEEEDEEIDPVSDDFEDKSEEKGHNVDDVSAEPLIKKARVVEDANIGLKSTNETVSKCTNSSFDLKRGFSPVMCS